MPMTPITGLDRTSPTFRTDLDTFFLSSLPAFVTEANALETAVDADRVAAAASAAAALVSKDAAAASQVAAGLSQVAAAASAASAINAPGTSATSTTSLTVGTGSKTLTIQTGKLFSVGQTLVIASTASPTNQMVGVITAHDNTTGSLTVNVATVAGTGTLSAWAVAIGVAGGGIPDQTGNTGKYLTTDGSTAAWGTVAQPVIPALKPFSAGRSLITSSGSTFTVPTGVSSIRAYVFGKGGDGALGNCGGGGGSCTWGTVPVTAGEIFTFDVTGTVASLKKAAVTYFSANAGGNGSASPGAAGAVGSVGSGLGITSSGTSSGGAGSNGGNGGGGASGSPIGTGGSGGGQGGGGWGGNGNSSGGGGAGSAGTSFGSGGSGPAVGNNRPGRDYSNAFADILLEPCISPGQVYVPSAIALPSGFNGGPGAGGGGHTSGASVGVGGSGGLGGGGGLGQGASGGRGGSGGFGGGGGGSSDVGGNGGIGGGGGGGSNTAGTGGSAAVLIFY